MTDNRLFLIRGALNAAACGESDEVLLDTGASYTEEEPVRVLVRKRGRRYDLDDRGAATRLTGKPRGWLEAAERVVAEEGFNINRSGVVFVGAFEGRDIAKIALGLADMSLAVYSELLELD